MNLKTLALILVIMALAAGLFLIPSGYGKVSGEAYELAIASYGACLSKSEQRIDKIEAILESPEFSDKLSRQENRWFRKLIAKARSERWEQAASIAKEMMLDQVEKN